MKNRLVVLGSQRTVFLFILRVIQISSSKVYICLHLLHDLNALDFVCLVLVFVFLVCFLKAYHAVMLQLSNLQKFYLLRFSRKRRYIYINAAGRKALPDLLAWQEC